jgi:hypothetical protein
MLAFLALVVATEISTIELTHHDVTFEGIDVPRVNQPGPNPLW